MALDRWRMRRLTSQGPVAFHLGCLATLLERPDDAEGYFAEALEVSQEMAFPYWVARTQIESARLVRSDSGERCGKGRTSRSPPPCETAQR